MSLGPSADGTKPFVKEAITVVPSAIFGTAVIFLIVLARNKEGDAIIRNSLPVATSIISLETVRFSESLYPGRYRLFSCSLLTDSFTSGSKAHI